MNEFQAAAAKVYGDGDYAYLVEEENPEFAGVGDTLFTFIMVELSTSEGTDSLDEAVRRMSVAKGQIEDVIQALLGE